MTDNATLDDPATKEVRNAMRRSMHARLAGAPPTDRNLLESGYRGFAMLYGCATLLAFAVGLALWIMGGRLPTQILAIVVAGVFLTVGSWLLARASY